MINIIIPLYNEGKIIAKTIETLIHFLAQSGFPYEYVITLANNASTDNSLMVCEELTRKFRQVRILDLTGKGKGRAIRAAWTTAEAEILTFMDADLSSDLSFFRSLIDAVVVEGYDLATGNRLGKNSKIINRRFLRSVASRLYNIFIRVLFKTSISDHQCGFKAMSKQAFFSVAPLLEDNAWFFDTELIVMARQQGLKIKPIDIMWSDNTDSKVTLGRTSYEMFRAAWKLKKRLKQK